MRDVQPSPHIEWRLQINLYVMPRSADRVVLPIHKTGIRFREGSGQLLTASSIEFLEPARSGLLGQGPGSDSETILTTGGEAIISGPGRLVTRALYYEPEGEK